MDGRGRRKEGEMEGSEREVWTWATAWPQRMAAVGTGGGH